jgi:hypothetical protein
MLRQAGLDAPGALRHIMVRGIDRKKYYLTIRVVTILLDRFCGILSDSKTACLLNLSGGKILEARSRYLAFVKKGGAEFGTKVCDPGSGLGIRMLTQ